MMMKYDPAQLFGRFLDRQMPGAFQLEHSRLGPEIPPHSDGSFDGAEGSRPEDDVNRTLDPGESFDPVNRAQHSQVFVRNFVIDVSKRDRQIGSPRPMPAEPEVSNPASDRVGEGREVRVFSHRSRDEQFEVPGGESEGVDQDQAVDAFGDQRHRGQREYCAAAIADYSDGMRIESGNFGGDLTRQFFQTPFARRPRPTASGQVGAIKRRALRQMIRERRERRVIAAPAVQTEEGPIAISVPFNKHGNEQSPFIFHSHNTIVICSCQNRAVPAMTNVLWLWKMKKPQNLRPAA